MQLDPDAFNEFLSGIGQQVSWRRSFACACVKTGPSASGQADPKCPICSGKGWFWPGAAVPTVCGVAGQNTQAKWAAMGQWQDGDIVVTLPGDSPMWEIGRFDRVVMLNASDRFSQPLTRGGPGEKLLFQVESLERVFWIAKPANTIEEGLLPIVNADGTLTWPSSGAVPPAGTSYSLTGRKFSEYFCYDRYPSNRNEHSGARLPRKVILRRFDLFGR